MTVANALRFLADVLACKSIVPYVKYTGDKANVSRDKIIKKFASMRSLVKVGAP